LSGSSSTTMSTAAADMLTLPSVPPISSLSTSSMLASPSLLATTAQYIPCGPSVTRDLEPGRIRRKTWID